MTIVAHLDLELYQIDVKIVLLHSELKEEIYIYIYIYETT